MCHSPRAPIEIRQRASEARGARCVSTTRYPPSQECVTDTDRDSRLKTTVRTPRAPENVAADREEQSEREELQQWHSRRDAKTVRVRVRLASCCCVPIAHEIMDNKSRKSNQDGDGARPSRCRCLFASKSTVLENVQYSEKGIPRRTSTSVQVLCTTRSERWSEESLPLDRLDKLDFGNVRLRVTTSKAHRSGA